MGRLLIDISRELEHEGYGTSTFGDIFAHCLGSRGYDPFHV